MNISLLFLSLVLCQLKLSVANEGRARQSICEIVLNPNAELVQLCKKDVEAKDEPETNVSYYDHIDPHLMKQYEKRCSYPKAKWQKWCKNFKSTYLNNQEGNGSYLYDDSEWMKKPPAYGFEIQDDVENGKIKYPGGVLENDGSYDGILIDSEKNSNLYESEQNILDQNKGGVNTGGLFGSVKDWIFNKINKPSQLDDGSKYGIDYYDYPHANNEDSSFWLGNKKEPIMPGQDKGSIFDNSNEISNFPYFEDKNMPLIVQDSVMEKDPPINPMFPWRNMMDSLQDSGVNPMGPLSILLRSMKLLSLTKGVTRKEDLDSLKGSYQWVADYDPKLWSLIVSKINTIKKIGHPKVFFEEIAKLLEHQKKDCIIKPTRNLLPLPFLGEKRRSPFRN